jgi:hypothetical protein
MHRLVVLAAVAVLAAGIPGCARDAAGSRDSSSTILGPTALGAPTVTATGGKGGGTKPSGGGSSSLTLVMVTDTNSNGLPNWGDSVTFKVSTTATTEPHVDLTCSQSGTVVFGATTGFYPSYPWPWTQIMTLSSPSWQSGAANCTAVLYYFSGRKNVILASTSFTALQ